MFKNLTLKKILKELITTALFIFIAANVISYFRAPELSSTKLPSIEQTLISGKVFNTQEYKGKPLMIHFWATWCPICKAEASNIESVSKEYNVLTIALKSGKNSEVLSYLQKRNLHFQTLNDTTGYYANAFKVSVFPTTFIYDKKGNLRFSEVGYTSTLMLKLKMWYLSL